MQMCLRWRWWWVTYRLCLPSKIRGSSHSAGPYFVPNRPSALGCASEPFAGNDFSWSSSMSWHRWAPHPTVVSRHVSLLRPEWNRWNSQSSPAGSAGSCKWCTWYVPIPCDGWCHGNHFSPIASHSPPCATPGRASDPACPFDVPGFRERISRSARPCVVCREPL